MVSAAIVGTSAPGVWELRCRATKAYFESLQQVLDEPPTFWLAQYGKRTDLDIAAVMSLLHPKVYVGNSNYQSLARSGVCPVRGARAFKTLHLPPAMSCESSRFWAYDCVGKWRHASAFAPAELDDDAANFIRQDHVFPYSFGGVTTLDNQGLLCGLHNGIKAHDVHVWQWESWQTLGAAPQWVWKAVGKVHTFLR